MPPQLVASVLKAVLPLGKLDAIQANHGLLALLQSVRGALQSSFGVSASEDQRHTNAEDIYRGTLIENVYFSKKITGFDPDSPCRFHVVSSDAVKLHGKLLLECIWFSTRRCTCVH